MKIVFDTNIFVTSVIDKIYKDAIIEFINKPNAFLTFSLHEELTRIFYKVHTLLIKISEAYSYDGGENCLKEPDFIELKDNFSNFYSVLGKLKNNPNVSYYAEMMADTTATILAEIGKVRIFPTNNHEAEKKIEELKTEKITLGKSMNNHNDIEHLILSEAYGKQVKDYVSFVTDDYKDIVNNKALIESILKCVKVTDFKSREY